MTAPHQFLGIVHNRRFSEIDPGGSLDLVMRLTSLPMQAAQGPEAKEIDLSPFQGKAIMVQGHSGGGWIYEATIVDEAGPILTAVVQKLFGRQFA